MTMYDDDVSGDDLVGADDALELLGVSGDDDDDVSGDDLVGDDDDEIGAAVRRIKRGAPLAAAMRKLVARTKWKAKRRTLGRQRAHAIGAGQRQIPLGVDVGAAGIAAAAQATINVETTVALRITDFFVSPGIAEDFNVNSINIGRTNLLASADGVFAGYFDLSNGGQRAPIEFPLLPAGTVASVVVTNLSGANRRFRGAFQGIDLTTKVK